MKVVRVLRALKLIKLARLLRSSRIVRRWSAHFAIDQSVLVLTQSLVAVLIFSHWGACLWGLQASFHLQTSWLGAFGFCDGTTTNECRSPITLYIAAYFWAVNTLLTVGASLRDMPQADVIDDNSGAAMEVVMANLFTLLSALLWATLIARLAGTFAAASPHHQAERNALADVNEMAANHRLPHMLRVQLRNHLHLAAHIERTKAQQGAIARLSPALQQEVCSFLYDEHMRKVWFLSDVEHALRLRLASRPLLPSSSRATSSSAAATRATFCTRCSCCAKGACTEPARTLART